MLVGPDTSTVIGLVMDIDLECPLRRFESILSTKNAKSPYSVLWDAGAFIIMLPYFTAVYIAKTCRSTRTAFASELGAEGSLGALVSHY